MPASQMITDQPYLDQLVSKLPDALEGVNSEAWDSTAKEIEDSYRLLSLSTSSPSIAIHEFLNSARGQERFYWSEPITSAGNLTIVGVGIAAEIRVKPILDQDNHDPLPGFRFEEVSSQVKRLFSDAICRLDGGEKPPTHKDQWPTHPARPRLFGGFAFQDDFVPDNTWSVFSSAHFVLPHFQLVNDGVNTFLTINALVSTDEDLEESFAALYEAIGTRLTTVKADPVSYPTVTEIDYPLSQTNWAAMVNQATDEIRTGIIEKVVLSRVCEVRAKEPIDATATLVYLDSQYGDSYRFIFEPVPGHAFFGATPELLLKKMGDQIETMALAGSIGRGQSLEEDELLGRELLTSDKDRHEHQLVVEAIRRRLGDPTAELSLPARPTLLRLRNIQHLLTPMAGRLHSPQTNILALVRLLHPTPAMGGVPAERSLAFLRRVEPVPRGWYAAPIGWLDASNNGVFAVGIRAAVTQHSRAWLYAGAGIVADSTPEREWRETALKFRPMLGALGVEEAI